MRRKTEDELIRLAFGDFEPDEADRAKRSLDEDASAAKLFASYADLREGLKQLKAPEHQLSTERLRERILAEGLRKEKAPWLTWRWSLTPLAVAASALLITFALNSRQSGLTRLPGGVGVAMNAPAEVPPVIDWEPTPSNVDEIVRSTASGAHNLSASSLEPAAASRRIKPVSTARTMTASFRGAPRSEGARAITPEELSSLAIDGALPAGAVALHEVGTGSDPIVLIGADSDETTGANRATEVSSATNVVIGG